jgi:hypothetical protein
VAVLIQLSFPAAALVSPRRFLHVSVEGQQPNMTGNNVFLSSQPRGGIAIWVQFSWADLDTA